MQYDRLTEGDFRIRAGAAKVPSGNGYIAAVVVTRWRGEADTPREVYRDTRLAGGHRWTTREAAVSYAVSVGREIARTAPERLSRTGVGQPARV
ncbi:hypothetical protein [Piscinibacter sp.]|jgi:hypothetical protein|uniref:hypothetical protein n=1 Tax=Piscinibacter sp. TaxID=1903157 RepID=UPI00355A95AD